MRKLNDIISSVLFIVILYDIITFFYGLLLSKRNSNKDLGEILFEESIKYYKKIIHFIGISLALIIFSKAFYEYPLIFIAFLLFIGTKWLYTYFSKRLVITTNGIGYKDVFKYVIYFVNWNDIEFIYIEKTKIIAYLKIKEKKKYYIDLTNEELDEVQKYLPENIKSYVYRT